MKENLKLISDLVTEGMIFEDSLGNFDYDFTSDAFSDNEETNHLNKMTAVHMALTKEIERCRPVPTVEAESGKLWKDTKYWTSANGDILVSDLGDTHLSRIPRFLYNHGIVENSRDLPPVIVEEIKKRGFTLNNDCTVDIKKMWRY